MYNLNDATMKTHNLKMSKWSNSTVSKISFQLGILSMVLFMSIGTATAQTKMDQLQQEAPNNWGKWGENDQIGTLNYLDEDQTLRGIKAVKSGKRFTLQIPMIHGVGPVFPGRIPVMHYMTQDEASYANNKMELLNGGMKYSDDVIFMYLQGTSHVDALGHAWYGNYVYNGIDASNTVNGHDLIDIQVLGEEGITGRGVLLDIGTFLGDDKGRLAPNTCISLDDLKKVIKAEGVTIQKRDILIIRTGSMGRYYDLEDNKNWSALTEPGLCYSTELIQWLADMEISFLAADNLAVEKTPQEIDGESVGIPLHGALIRDLGLVLSELYWLEDLAEDCKKDGQYTFFFAAAPLKMDKGTGAPVNPIVIK